MKNAWYNYKTQEYEFLSDTPAALENYIPQMPAALNLYRLGLEIGHTPLEAAAKVLKACIPDETEISK